MRRSSVLKHPNQLANMKSSCACACASHSASPRGGFAVLLPVTVIGLWVLTSTVSGADSWEQAPDMPEARVAHTALWTGKELIVWVGGGIDGGFLDTGARFVPSQGHWQETSTTNAPPPRWFHAAVWTGTEMLVWGGRASFFAEAHQAVGGRYDPALNRWRPISASNAPVAWSQCAAVWTGTELIVWGGVTDGGAELNDGARYDPVRDTSRPMAASGLEPRLEPSYVWTGSELIVYGGLTLSDGERSFGNGARYQPKSDTWTPLPASGGPGSRTAHTLVWTGSRLIVWGGRRLPEAVSLNSGA